ncbi:MAG: serine--tRNA ligase [Candidatus Ryanbacteria bacterium RIFCSPHIGHO2_02_FULL_45_17b]|uniref:Serine--tRNA ligase n=1 Tax=Candidatus Ryanbacteria bacterium RIFCSPHIGHO2_01_FULL_45_22 TaxID=1802114 RepID=A0A1G2G2D4_9BACT|nr:MAG: serine--tRNA ligase [Candidatus Ryanbacteria bacterium RIFCSPHIGHO2_01_FULL_45_22]OGZ47153.1 MAG: serine--tRNA ligase [Candidatus Ryanbacteria bacterium RIFCSPHIGHO2_02_FULL_45_17b]
MLDIGFIRDNPDLIKEAVRKKRADIDVDNLLGLDEKRRGLIKETDTFRAQQNTASEKISHMAGEEREEAIVAMRELKERISHKEEELRIIEEEYTQLLLLVPNIPDLSVPDGNSDADNQEVRTYGEKPHFTFEPKDHITLLQELDLADFERGAKVSGFRGYFLKGDAAMLSLALWQFAFEALEKKGFTVHMAPALVRGATLVGTGWLPQGKDEVYKVGNDLYLSGTAEVSMMGMFEDEIFEAKDLPMTVAGFSSCFRSEAGSYGKDTKGLYRVHEFMKVEQVVLCQADHEESVKWHEELTKNAEEMLQQLDLPYRVVVNCGADLGLGQVKKYDIETWIPSQQKYGETHSSSYFHDFQTRRLNIRYRDAEGKLKFAHSLNNTMIATPRILISLLENYQQEDRSVMVPEVLRKWMGKERIERRK